MSGDKPVNIIAALAVLLLCQLAGEMLVLGVRVFAPGFAFPGPVIGMALLFIVLALRGGAGASLEATAGGILRNLSLLFVPVAVGVVQIGGVINAHGWALLAALVVSTVLTLLVTAGVFAVVARQMQGRGGDDA